MSGRQLRRLLCGVPTTLNSQLTVAEVDALFKDFDIQDTDTIVLHDFYTRLRGDSSVSSGVAGRENSGRHAAQPASAATSAVR
ncbi:MAG: hypothetical protein EOO41_04910 [Methanobacteriota archaeon]|nr:MAG: hypothetical protein EOO41_04910 [Euryarchaeota archaeon]